MTTIRNITAKRIFKEHPEVKKIMWCRLFWSGGYFVSNVVHSS